jgi:hypothetical protein
VKLVDAKQGHSKLLLFTPNLLHLQPLWNTSLANFCQQISLWLCIFLELNKVVHSVSVLSKALQLLFVHLKHIHILTSQCSPLPVTGLVVIIRILNLLMDESKGSNDKIQTYMSCHMYIVSSHLAVFCFRICILIVL